MPTKRPRQYYLKQKICPNCKCREVKEGYTACEVCLEANSKWMRENRARKNKYNKERYDSLVQQGLCVVCKNPTDGNVYCKLCTTRKVSDRAYNRPLHSRNSWSKR
jgi:hypothetical protein